MITIITSQTTPTIDTEWLTSLVSHLLKELEYPQYDLGILLATNDEMATYNETYRHKKGPTDILSFAYHTLSPGERIEPLTEEDKNLGDLILAPAYIQSFCEKENIPFAKRILELVIHGTCHLLGYDHEEDAEYEAMKVLEEKLLRSLPVDLVR